MCKILLSINPEHVENIFNGSKEYEFRKVKCKEPVDKIIIYSTAPVMKVVGEAKVEKIIEGKPDEVWAQTKNKSGINESFYFDYYGDRLKAIAYKLVEVIQYKTPKELSCFGVSNAPQSFVYIKGKHTIN